MLHFLINYKRWQLTMYYHIRPPDAMQLITLNFGGPGHQRLNFGGSIYIHCAAPPYSAGIVIMHSERLGRVSKNSGPVLLWHLE